MDRDPFKEYLRQSEPGKQEKGYAWHTAIGLQAVDGLKTSRYLIDTAIKNLNLDEIIHHLAVFVSGLWQIHVFGEGNTRTTAVFFIKYLRMLGFDATNDIFAENAWYFRNAMVRANVLSSKCNNCTLEELTIIRAIAQNPGITQKELARAIGKSERTVKSRTVEMQEKRLIARENGKRNGKWIILHYTS